MTQLTKTPANYAGVFVNCVIGGHFIASLVGVVIALLINNVGHKKAWPKYWF